MTALLSQAWRVARLFGATFGHAAWVTALTLPSTDKAVILAGVVGATEAAYRQAIPSGKLSGVFNDLVAGYKMVQAQGKAAQAASHGPG